MFYFNYNNENLSKEEKEEQRTEFREKCKTCMYVCGVVMFMNAAIHSFSNPNKELSSNALDAII